MQISNKYVELTIPPEKNHSVWIEFKESGTEIFCSKEELEQLYQHLAQLYEV